MKWAGFKKQNEQISMEISGCQDLVKFLRCRLQVDASSKDLPGYPPRTIRTGTRCPQRCLRPAGIRRTRPRRASSSRRGASRLRRAPSDRNFWSFPPSMPSTKSWPRCHRPIAKRGSARGRKGGGGRAGGRTLGGLCDFRTPSRPCLLFIKFYFRAKSLVKMSFIPQFSALADVGHPHSEMS